MRKNEFRDFMETIEDFGSAQEVLDTHSWASFTGNQLDTINQYFQ
jgi:hypothetical protein